MTTQYVLREWIDETKLDWIGLSANPSSGAIALLEANPDRIDWVELSANPSPGAIALLEANPDRIDWVELSANPTAGHLLVANQDKIDWVRLSKNPHPVAVWVLLKSPDKIDWRMLCGNKNPDVIELISETLRTEEMLGISHKKGKINNWRALFANPGAIEIIKRNSDKLKWNCDEISRNPNGIDILKRNPEYINWEYLSKNPGAMDLLEANQDKIDWLVFSTNPAPRAISLLIDNRDKIVWGTLATNANPDAMKLLGENQEKITWDKMDWNVFSRMPSIFEEFWFSDIEEDADQDADSTNEGKIEPNKISDNVSVDEIDTLLDFVSVPDVVATEPSRETPQIPLWWQYEDSIVDSSPPSIDARLDSLEERTMLLEANAPACAVAPDIEALVEERVAMRAFAFQTETRAEMAAEVRALMEDYREEMATAAAIAESALEARIDARAAQRVSDAGKAKKAAMDAALLRLFNDYTNAYWENDYTHEYKPDIYKSGFSSKRPEDNVEYIKRIYYEYEYSGDTYCDTVQFRRLPTGDIESFARTLFPESACYARDLNRSKSILGIASVSELTNQARIGIMMRVLQHICIIDNHSIKSTNTPYRDTQLGHLGRYRPGNINNNIWEAVPIVHMDRIYIKITYGNFAEIHIDPTTAANYHRGTDRIGYPIGSGVMVPITLPEL